MLKSKKTRNYAATDSTLINLRALKRRVSDLERQMKHVLAKVKKLPAL